MIRVAKKNSDPAEIYAINEEESSSYPEEDWIYNPASLDSLLGSGLSQYDLAVDDTDVYERTVTLEEVKKKKINAIDAKTDELISQGFLFGTNGVFSLSRQAQANMLGVRTSIADHRSAGTLDQFEAIFFPIVFNTLNDDDSVTLNTVEDFQSFYDSAMLTVRTHLDGGTALKQAVRNAITVEDVEAIVDNR